MYVHNIKQTNKKKQTNKQTKENKKKPKDVYRVGCTKGKAFYNDAAWYFYTVIFDYFDKQRTYLVIDPLSFVSKETPSKWKKKKKKKKKS